MSLQRSAPLVLLKVIISLWIFAGCLSRTVSGLCVSLAAFFLPLTHADWFWPAVSHYFLCSPFLIYWPYLIFVLWLWLFPENWWALDILSNNTVAPSAVLDFCSKTGHVNWPFSSLFLKKIKLAGGVTPQTLFNLVGKPAFINYFCCCRFFYLIPLRSDFVQLFYSKTLERFPWGKGFMLTSPWWPRSKLLKEICKLDMTKIYFSLS